jgi:hypothetical protein
VTGYNGDRLRFAASVNKWRGEFVWPVTWTGDVKKGGTLDASHKILFLEWRA